MQAHQIWSDSFAERLYSTALLLVSNPIKLVKLFYRAEKIQIYAQSNICFLSSVFLCPKQQSNFPW
ncbi:MAG TPA: hypothetical protein DCY88_22485 [Cyanobacteria bacterium UBA11372]|nr:hypothetical protein [Cyanobacteria bacterium UBA11372]